MASSVSPDGDDDGSVLVSEQGRELMEAEAIESDMDLAFRLQLQEALAASLALQPPPNDAAPTNPAPMGPTPASFLREKLPRLEQEAKDRAESESETRRAREDLNRRIDDHHVTLQPSSSSSSAQPPSNDAVPTISTTPTLPSFLREEMRRTLEDLSRRIHDHHVAREIERIPAAEWEASADFYAKPFGEGTSSSSGKGGENKGESVFRLYFKGLVSEEAVGKEKAVMAGIGVAICDPGDNLVFEVRKPLIGNGRNRNGAQLKALIEGLTAALDLGLKRITFFCENRPIFQFVTGKWPVKQRKIAVLVNQVKSLRGKFITCNPRLVPRNAIKFAFKLARDAIVSQCQTNQPAQSTTCKNVNETCAICLEETDVSKIFSVDGCLHRYCFSCMKQHAEVKLLHGMIPRCPHEDCKSDLSVDNCAKFLSPKHVETMRQRIKEASIPATEKVYCPYPRCSALMSKHELLEHTKETLRDVALSGIRRCMKCHFLFCINCKVPWHKSRTCSDYKKLNPHPPEEDTKLKFLASRNLWRQCVKCNHMIELSEGCYHMTCRCGYEFCYNCGAEWKDKKATCSCPLWDEGNILHDEDDEDFDEEVSESESEYYESDSDYHHLLHGNEFCRDCGAEWKDKMVTCSCALSDEDNYILSREYTEYPEEEDEDEDEDEEEYGGEDEEDEGEEEVLEEKGDDIQEEKHMLSAEDDESFDEDYEEDEEVQEKEIQEDVHEEEEMEVQAREYNLPAEDDTDFEYCDYDCYDSDSDYCF